MFNGPILWNSEDLQRIFGQGVPLSITGFGVSIDSRTIKKGDIFIAIQGKNFDGHEFVENAVNNGANCVIVSSKPSNLKHADVILVDDTTKALEMLAKASRSRLSGIPVGITGSVGKTTSKEMFKCALKDRQNIYATTGSLNNHIGVPLTLANMPQDTSVALLEMGINHSDELRHLSKLCMPKIAIITAIEAVHATFFQSLADIARAKAEIFEGMKEGDSALLPYEALHYDVLYQKAHDAKLDIITFGRSGSCDVQLLEVDQVVKKLYIKARFLSNIVKYVIPICGEHFAMNSIAVLMAAKLAGMNLEEAAYNLQYFEPIKGRGAEINLTNGVTVLDECYNASPVAVQAALRTLSHYRNMKSTRRIIAILGDMGETPQRFHTELLEHIIKFKVDVVFTVGTMMQYLYDILPTAVKGIHKNTAQEMSKEIEAYITKGDVVLIKGARFLKMEQIISQLVNGRDDKLRATFKK